MNIRFVSLCTAFLALTSLLAACGGGGGGTAAVGETAAGKNSVLYSVLASAPTGSCANGGITVYAGVDTSGNAVLDPSEVTSTQYVCNGADGSNGTNGTNGQTALVSLVSEPSGTNCANGGRKVNVGMDTNNNGLLDSPEITSSNYICNGSNGTNGTNGTNGYNSLVSIVDDTAYCANGGKEITSGLDANGNNVLDSNEIVSANYICNGADGTNGTDGADGYNTLINIAAEPVGGNCAYGGKKITTGPDTNRNNILDANEIIGSPQYVCNGAGINWVTVRTTSVLAVANTGYLTDSAAQVAVTLPASPSPGDIFSITGIGTGGWKAAQSAGQTIITKNIPESIGANWVARDSYRLWGPIASSADGTKLVAAEMDGQLYTSINAGATWIPRESSRHWFSVASSSDGIKLVAAENGGRIYTSTNAGATWTPRDSNRYWMSVASSSDGTKLAAVVKSGQIYTSTDSGVTWTPRDADRTWQSIASSSDGTKLVAVVNNGQIYTSTDSGFTWTPRAFGGWFFAASSSDGTKLVAVEKGGRIYTSNDSGINWTPRDSNRDWYSVASSSDGTKLVAVEFGGRIYNSTDSGVTWTQRDSNRNWIYVASSSDGSKLTAMVHGGQIYTSTAATTPGTAGSISGGQYDSIELQYVGSNTFTILSHEGSLTVQ